MRPRVTWPGLEDGALVYVDECVGAFAGARAGVDTTRGGGCGAGFEVVRGAGTGAGSGVGMVVVAAVVVDGGSGGGSVGTVVTAARATGWSAPTETTVASTPPPARKAQTDARSGSRPDVPQSDPKSSWCLSVRDKGQPIVLRDAPVQRRPTGRCDRSQSARPRPVTVAVERVSQTAPQWR